MRGQCLIYDDGMSPGDDMQPWFDMPESEPRTRARLKNRGTSPVLLTIEDDGSISGNLIRVVLDTDYEY